MKVSRLAILLFSLALIACATSYTPRTNSREDLVAYVNRAAALVGREGPAACPTFSESRWMQGDYYIFVSDFDSSVVVCHPVRPDMVGQNQDALRDVNGVYIVREMRARTTSPDGRGWVEYMWPRPGQTTPERKSAYVVAVTGPDGKRYIVGSGGYGM